MNNEQYQNKMGFNEWITSILSLDYKNFNSSGKRDYYVGETDYENMQLLFNTLKDYFKIFQTTINPSVHTYYFTNGENYFSVFEIINLNKPHTYRLYGIDPKVLQLPEYSFITWLNINEILPAITNRPLEVIAKTVKDLLNESYSQEEIIAALENETVKLKNELIRKRS